jgi:hypothetical protein
MALSDKQRSEIARRAAQAAHRTMKSKGYVAAKKKSPTAVKTFLANRTKAA